MSNPSSAAASGDFFALEVAPGGGGAWGVYENHVGRLMYVLAKDLPTLPKSVGWITTDVRTDVPRLPVHLFDPLEGLPLEPCPPVLRLPPRTDPPEHYRGVCLPTTGPPLYDLDLTNLVGMSMAARSRRVLVQTNLMRDTEALMTAFSVPQTHEHVQAAPVQGALILEARRGVWRMPVTVADVKAMYPSIMIDLEETMPALAHMMRHLREWRSRFPCLKLLMNSVYGLLASQHSRFYDPEAANAITARGRDVLRGLQASVERQGGCVLFGVTDSVAYVSHAPIILEPPSNNIQLDYKVYDGCIVFNKTVHALLKDGVWKFNGPLGTEPEHVRARLSRYVESGGGIEGDWVGEALPERLRKQVDEVRDECEPLAFALGERFSDLSRRCREFGGRV